MSDAAATLNGTRAWGSDISRKRLRRRYAADTRLKIYGLAAIGLAMLLVEVLVC